MIKNKKKKRNANNNQNKNMPGHIPTNREPVSLNTATNKKINHNNNNSEKTREIDMDQLCDGWDWRDKFHQYTKIDDAFFMFLRAKAN